MPEARIILLGMIKNTHYVIIKSTARSHFFLKDVSWDPTDRKIVPH